MGPNFRLPFSADSAPEAGAGQLSISMAYRPRAEGTIIQSYTNRHLLRKAVRTGSELEGLEIKLER